jgi:iron complex transport system ATP-binding protein
MKQEKNENKMKQGGPGASGKKTLLKTVDLGIGYRSGKRETRIASGLDLVARESEVICLLGQNGVGKSTLLRTLSRMQPALEGEIRIGNRSLDEISRNELATKIGLVLTERIPDTNLTVYEMVALGRQPYTNWIGKMGSDDEARVVRALKDSHLSELAEERCDELSDGQLQRAMICRAVAQDTQLIFLDEPTAHLDIQHKIETFQLLRKLAKELNRTVLISTHEVQLATQMADVLWLMNSEGIISGKPDDLIEAGSINELFDRNTIVFDKESRQFKIK